MVFLAHPQVSSLSAVCWSEFVVSSGESDMCSAGEDDGRAGEEHRPGARHHQ